MWKMSTTSTASQTLRVQCRGSSGTTSRVRQIPASAPQSSRPMRASCSFRFGSRSSLTASGTQSPGHQSLATAKCWCLSRPLRNKTVVKSYTAVGLIPAVRGIRRRKDIKINLDHLQHLIKAASWLSALDIPVRLIALPEGALQAFNDEVLDL